MELSEKTVEMLLENQASINASLQDDVKYFRNELEEAKSEYHRLRNQMDHMQMQSRQFIPVDEFKDLFDPEFVTTKKINTIKAVRAITGLGLKEAKELTEEYLVPFMQSVIQNDTHGTYQPTNLPKAQKADASMMWDDDEYHQYDPNDNGHTLGDILAEALKEN